MCDLMDGVSKEKDDEMCLCYHTVGERRNITKCFQLYIREIENSYQWKASRA